MDYDYFKNLPDRSEILRHNPDGDVFCGIYSKMASERYNYDQIWAWWGESFEQAHKYRSFGMGFSWAHPKEIICLGNDEDEDEKEQRNYDECNCEILPGGFIIHTKDCPYMIDKYGYY